MLTFQSPNSGGTSSLCCKNALCNIYSGSQRWSNIASTDRGVQAPPLSIFYIEFAAITSAIK